MYGIITCSAVILACGLYTTEKCEQKCEILLYIYINCNLKKQTTEYQSDVVFGTVVSHEDGSWFESTGLLGPTCVVSGYSRFLPQICMG